MHSWHIYHMSSMLKITKTHEKSQKSETKPPHPSLHGIKSLLFLYTQCTHSTRTFASPKLFSLRVHGGSLRLVRRCLIVSSEVQAKKTIPLDLTLFFQHPLSPAMRRPTTLYHHITGWMHHPYQQVRQEVGHVLSLLCRNYHLKQVREPGFQCFVLLVWFFFWCLCLFLCDMCNLYNLCTGWWKGGDWRFCCLRHCGLGKDKVVRAPESPINRIPIP